MAVQLGAALACCLLLLSPVALAGTSDPEFNCVSSLAEAGLLYRGSDSAGYSFAGACSQQNAYGECVQLPSNSFLFDICSDDCRDEVRQVSSECRAILSANDPAVGTLFDSCKGSRTPEDCDSATSGGFTPGGQEPSDPSSSGGSSSSSSGGGSSGGSSSSGGGSSSGSSSGGDGSSSSSGGSSSSSSGSSSGGSSSSAAEKCGQDLADKGVLFDSNLDGAGPCTEDGAYGQCVNSLTNEVAFDYCSTACRNEIKEVSSSCASTLSDINDSFRRLVLRCTGSGRTSGDSCGSLSGAGGSSSSTGDSPSSDSSSDSSSASSSDGPPSSSGSSSSSSSSDAPPPSGSSSSGEERPSFSSSDPPPSSSIGADEPPTLLPISRPPPPRSGLANSTTPTNSSSTISSSAGSPSGPLSGDDTDTSFPLPTEQHGCRTAMGGGLRKLGLLGIAVLGLLV